MDKEELINELEKLRNREKHYRIIMDESSDPFFSFYADGTYRYVNKAFAKGVGKDLDKIIGNKIWDVFEKEEADKRFAVVKKVLTEGKTEEIEVRVPLPSGDTYYLTTAKPIFNDDCTVETVICTSKNITKRKLAEDALKENHERLLKANKEIKALAGLLPICAECKKIRDDKGYWNLLESYIEKHSDASFTYGMCPDCSDKVYGKENWYIEMKKKKQKK
ncbi:MAG: PAS domain S-box protein [Desulfobacterales bacterium]|nr:PAS domain S-box protein [Desulfobacterales bacterium]